MARLFVAIDLPDAVTCALTALQPPPSAEMRLASAEQMHLTLHYVGVSECERIALALSSVAAQSFALSIEGVGRFYSAGNAQTLWAGIRPSPELLDLHRGVAHALSAEGYRPEARPFTPHVTIARCEPTMPAETIEDFLARHAAFSLPAVAVASFSLYSSEFAGDVPTYKRERTYPLFAPEGRQRPQPDSPA